MKLTKKINYSMVNDIQSNISIDQIEACIVKIFLSKNKILTKNIFIQKIIMKCNNKDIEITQEWINHNKINLNLKNIERIFELLIDTKERKLNGAYFTPQNIVEYIIKKTISRDTKTVCDCSCGSGSFLVKATEKIYQFQHIPISKILEKQIFGIDIFPRNIKRTKIILILFMLIKGEDKKSVSFNLISDNSLTLKLEKVFPKIFKEGGFDAVIGNPPYVRAKNIPENIREHIHNKEWVTAPKGKADLYIPFIELGMRWVNPKGKCGLITPNGYFTLLATKQLREFLHSKKLINEIVNFDDFQIFQDVTIYTCITILDKKPKNSFNYLTVNSTKQLESINKLKIKDFIKIKFDTLDDSKWILLDKQEKENIKKIETIGEQLKSVCKIRTGIATLKNELYVIKNDIQKEDYYEINYNGKIFHIEISITKEILKSGVIKNQNDIKNNSRRIIYPYVKNKDTKRMDIIHEKEMQMKYPECYSYFLEIKKELALRDKGKKKYKEWYAYGRTQGLENFDIPKLIMPDMEENPRFVLCEKPNVLFYTGYGLWLNQGKSITLDVLKKILVSKIFKYYMDKTSKPYQRGYRSYAKRFIENFSIPKFSQKELSILKKSSNVDDILIEKYQIKI
jgi:adenine-specific DNA-methyltransferase